MQPEQQPEPTLEPAAQTPPTPQPLGSQPASETTAITPKGKKVPLWLKIVLTAFGAVVGLIGLSVLGFFIYANSLIAAPMKVSDEFINAAQANDASTAYNLTSSEFKFVTKEDRLKSIFEQINKDIQGEEKVHDKHYLVSNGVSTATIIYIVPTENEPTYVRVVTREKNDKWEVIQMFTSKKELKANSK